MRLLLNWVREDLYSDKGFILSDALICIFIVSMTVLLVSSAVHSMFETTRLVHSSSEECEEEYRQKMYQIESCVISCVQDSEEPADI